MSYPLEMGFGSGVAAPALADSVTRSPPRMASSATSPVGSFRRYPSEYAPFAFGALVIAQLLDVGVGEHRQIGRHRDDRPAGTRCPGPVSHSLPAGHGDQVRRRITASPRAR